MDKGFLVTVSTLLLLMASLTLIQNGQKAGRHEERAVADAQAIDAAAYTFDDVAVDLNSMLGPQVDIARNSSESNITFGELLPRISNDGYMLSNYSSFIANYSNGTNTKITFDFSKILSGTLLVFSNGLQYGRNATAVRLYAPNAGTNVSAYELSIFSNGYGSGENISNINSMQSGSVKLVVHYSDLSGNIEASGTFDPNSAASYSVNYTSDPSGVITIRVGNFSGSSGSIAVEQSGSPSVWLNLTASGRWNGSLAYAYNANMNYSQLNVTKNDLVWAERD